MENDIISLSSIKYFKNSSGDEVENDIIGLSSISYFKNSSGNRVENGVIIWVVLSTWHISESQKYRSKTNGFPRRKNSRTALRIVVGLVAS